eukprot:CAMPEP_0204249830 /NCGR_PEP_ID=MMETSP0361-20130328/99860_1 /ASSEMBLY_ACC=CAM_ASM_000343 /TAXON_ID=268821 /ORGANISM="Scrippsiella Hangoei, Strain SHTV-5" /LENGTH=47 /DNA_ID= /DNA_START= /DNA_END= /DNA_ORIENTATION=
MEAPVAVIRFIPHAETKGCGLSVHPASSGPSTQAENEMQQRTISYAI